MKDTEMRRVISFDILRVIAILYVIMIHVSSSYLLTSEVVSIEFKISNIFNSISRSGVPLFLMLSGALNLDENRKVSQKKYVKSSLQMFVILLFWSLIYAFFYEMLVPLVESGVDGFSIDMFLQAFIEGHFHMWYIFVIIGLYMLTPVLRLFIKRENITTIMYFLVISIVIVFCVPLIDFIASMYVGDNLVIKYIDKFHFPMIGIYLTYYILGWFLANVEITKKVRTIICAMGIACLFVTVFGTYFMSYSENESNQFFYSKNLVTILCSSTAIFVFVFYCLKGKQLKSKSAKWLTLLSKLTFGVYLLHIIILSFVNKLFEYVIPAIEEKAFTNICVTFCLTAILSYVGSYIISKIPIMHRMIKC